MRVLLICIVILCAGIAFLAVIANISMRAEQIDMRGELLHSLQYGDPPVSTLLENHEGRLKRFQRYWAIAAALAAGSALASVICFGLSFRRGRQLESSGHG